MKYQDEKATAQKKNILFLNYKTRHLQMSDIIPETYVRADQKKVYFCDYMDGSNMLYSGYMWIYIYFS
jgi:hypothetical protein